MSLFNWLKKIFTEPAIVKEVKNTVSEFPSLNMSYDIELLSTLYSV